MLDYMFLMELRQDGIDSADETADSLNLTATEYSRDIEYAMPLRKDCADDDRIIRALVLSMAEMVVDVVSDIKYMMERTKK